MFVSFAGEYDFWRSSVRRRCVGFRVLIGGRTGPIAVEPNLGCWGIFSWWRTESSRSRLAHGGSSAARAGAQAPFELCRSASRSPGCRPRGLLRARRPRRLVARSPSPPASLLQGACRVRAAHPREYMAGPITALCRSPAALIAPAWSRSCGLEKKTENGNYGREFVKCESKAQPGKVCARFVDFGLPFISFCRFHVILA